MLAQKHDRAHKPGGFWLIPREFLGALADHYRKGAAKYGPNDWRMGRPWTDYIDALYRHLGEWVDGETHDADGHHNLIAVAWLAGALFTFEREHPELDDRGLKEARVRVVLGPIIHRRPLEVQGADND